MVKRITKHPTLQYGKFFLVTEAPGNEDPGVEVSETEVKPDTTDEYDTDFNALNDPEPTDAGEEEVGEDITNETEHQTEDIEPENQTTGDQQQVETPTEEVTNRTETTPETGQGNIENMQDETQTEEPTDGTEPPGEEAENPDEMTGDESGYENQDTNFNGADGAEEEQPTDGGGGNGPGVEFDSTRKFNLFKDFMSLYNSVSNYISRLESNVYDVSEINHIHMRAVDNFQEIKTLLYDYMTIKFEASTYVQSLVFYNQIVAAIQAIFNFINGKKIRQIKNYMSKQ